MKYDYQTLTNFCEEHNIVLCEDYSNITLKRETFITGICETENCGVLFCKGFRALFNYNGYCKDCVTKIGREKSKQTNFKKYGVEFTTQSKTVKDKIKKTCLEKYGVEHISLIKQVKDKTKKTCLEKYGVEYASQNIHIAEKQSINAHKPKAYIFPSGRIEKIQGYENFMINDLLKKCIAEDDIIVSRKTVPEIWYINSNGQKKRYFVDCFIKSENKCIEVKSTWTLEKKKNDILLHLFSFKTPILLLL